MTKNGDEISIGESKRFISNETISKWENDKKFALKKLTEVLNDCSFKRRWFASKKNRSLGFEVSETTEVSGSVRSFTIIERNHEINYTKEPNVKISEIGRVYSSQSFWEKISPDTEITTIDKGTKTAHLIQVRCKDGTECFKIKRWAYVDNTVDRSRKDLVDNAKSKVFHENVSGQAYTLCSNSDAVQAASAIRVLTR